MATYVTANEKAKNEFIIPVAWMVSDIVKVQANSLEEAYDYVKEHMDEIPCGDVPEYIEGSYEISADDAEECACYQSTVEPFCLNSCFDGNLKEFTDSMLFNSGKEVASARFLWKGKVIEIALEVRGEVSVTWGEEFFKKPSEFPTVVREFIKNNPNDWEYKEVEGKELYINSNNWFEFIVYDENPEVKEFLCSSDGYICEEDVSKMSEEDILESFKDIVKEHLGLTKNFQEVTTPACKCVCKNFENGTCMISPDDNGCNGTSEEMNECSYVFGEKEV